MKAIAMIFVLILSILTVSFAAEQDKQEKNSPVVADTVQIVIINDVQYYKASFTVLRATSVSLARLSSKTEALRKIALRIYGKNNPIVDYVIYGQLEHKYEFTVPEARNGKFKITATVWVPIKK